MDLDMIKCDKIKKALLRINSNHLRLMQSAALNQMMMNCIDNATKFINNALVERDKEAFRFRQLDWAAAPKVCGAARCFACVWLSDVSVTVPRGGCIALVPRHMCNHNCMELRNLFEHACLC